jgi:MFS family permease
MSKTSHSLLLLCLASAGWAFGFGLGAPLSSLWLRDTGCSARIIGLNSSVYYLGVVVAAFVVPALMRRAGRLCVVGGILVDAGVTIFFPWTYSLFGWFALRMIGGMATALSVIPLETLVNHNAAPHRRARDFGYYAFSVALGVALGSSVGLPLYPHFPRLVFALGGIITVGSGFLAWLGWPDSIVAMPETNEGNSLRLRENALSYATAWVQGFLEGGLLTFLCIYLLARSYSEGAVSLLVGGLFAGVILCQVPLAWLADRLGRLKVLVGCHLLLLVSLLTVLESESTSVLAIALCLLGMCCGALYPLGLALLGERVPSAGLAKSNACYLASNCIGSLCGPFVFGLVIDRFGLPSQFIAAIVSALLALVVWLASSIQKPKEKRHSFLESIVKEASTDDHSPLRRVAS